MPVVIDMPKLSDTMTTGTLVKWLKNEGDAVSSGDMIAEVETDKATMELENFEDGVLLKHYVKEGESVIIGAPICAVGQEGEEVPEAATGGSEPEAPKQKQAEPEQPKKEEAKGEVTQEEEEDEEVFEDEEDERVKASPLAKMVAREKGISLKGVKGSGPDGRIVKKDVLVVAEKKPAGVEAAGSKVAKVEAASSAPIINQALMSGEDKDMPVSNMRATIARRLVEAKAQAPHFYLEVEVDVEALVQMREEINRGCEADGIKFTINDFIMKATAVALKRVPAVNSSWLGDKIRQYASVHLAFGVAIEDGLVTPVIRDCQAKSLRQISLEAKDYIQKARNKKLKPEEMSGSTFTVTNLGMFGISRFYGIINLPNAAILSVGGTATKPVVKSDGTIGVGQIMTIGISGDHRVIDGASAAKFLAELRKLLEKPSVMLV